MGSSRGEVFFDFYYKVENVSFWGVSFLIASFFFLFAIYHHIIRSTMYIDKRLPKSTRESSILNAEYQVSR